MTDSVELLIKMPTTSLLKGAKALDNVDKAGAKAQKSLDGVSSNSGKASTGIAKVASSAGNATGSISSLSSKLGGLSTIIGGIGLASLATDAFSTFRSFESMNASLKTVTGSAEAAAEAFALIKDFAETTPYTLDQSVEGFQKLKALGLDPSISSLRSYGNTAAAMGKDMMQMIEAVADASTGEFERLKEFGIKAKSEGDNVSLTFQGVTTTIGKNSQEIQQYLLDIGNTQFASAMSDQMDTVDGKIANLSDSYASLQVTLMQNGGAQIATTAIETLTSVIESVEQNTKEWTIAIGVLSGVILKTQIVAIAALIKTKYSLVAAAIAASRQTTIMTTSVTRMGIATRVATPKVTGLTMAARGLSGVMAFLGGPVGLFAIAASSVFLYREEIMQAITYTGRLETATKISNDVISVAKDRAYEYANASESVRQALVKQAEAEINNAKAKLRANEEEVKIAKQRLARAKELDDIGSDDPFHVSLTDTRERELSAEVAILKKQEAAIEASKKALASYGKTVKELNVIYGEGTKPNNGKPNGKPPATPPNTISGVSAKQSEKDRADKLLVDSLRTAQEKYNLAIADYDKRLKDKRITQETYNRAVAAANKELADATKKAEKLTTATKTQTDAERYRNQLIEQSLTLAEKRDKEIKRINSTNVSDDVKAKNIARINAEYKRQTQTINKISEAEEYKNKLIEQSLTLAEKRDIAIKRVQSTDVSDDVKAKNIARINAEYEKQTATVWKMGDANKAENEAARARAQVVAETRTAYEKLNIAIDDLNKIDGLDDDTKKRKLIQLQDEYKKTELSIYKNSQAYKDKEEADKKASEQSKKTIAETKRVRTIFDEARDKIELFKTRLNGSKEASDAYALSVSEKLNPAKAEELRLLKANGEELEKDYNRKVKYTKTITDLAEQQAILNANLAGGKDAGRVKQITTESGISEDEAKTQLTDETSISNTQKLIDLRDNAKTLIEEQNKQQKLANILATEGADAVRLQELAAEGLSEKQAELYLSQEKIMTQTELQTAKTKEWQDSFMTAIEGGKEGIEDFFKTMIKNAILAQAQMALFGTSDGSGMGGVVGGVSSAITGFLGFSSGGYTGNGGTGEVAGVVHGQEYVVNAAATSKNRAALEAMNSGGTVDTGSENSGTMNVIVNLNEDSTKAGTTETSSMNGKQVIDVFVSNIRSGGAAASALESTYKVKRAGAF